MYSPGFCSQLGGIEPSSRWVHDALRQVQDVKQVMLRFTRGRKGLLILVALLISISLLEIISVLAFFSLSPPACIGGVFAP